MTTLFSRLKKAFPFVGERPATEADLFAFCAARGVEVVFAAEIRRGLYVRREGSDYIFLNASLLGWSLLYVLAHEIGHLLYHVPTRTRNASFAFDGDRCRRNHVEAETAAALLLLPVAELERSLLAGEYKTDERLAALIGVRIDYHSKYRK